MNKNAIIMGWVFTVPPEDQRKNKGNLVIWNDTICQVLKILNPPTEIKAHIVNVENFGNEPEIVPFKEIKALPHDIINDLLEENWVNIEISPAVTIEPGVLISEDDGSGVCEAYIDFADPQINLPAQKDLVENGEWFMKTLGFTEPKLLVQQPFPIK